MAQALLTYLQYLRQEVCRSRPTYEVLIIVYPGKYLAAVQQAPFLFSYLSIIIQVS